MYLLIYSAKFKKDFKKLKRNSNFKTEKLENIFDILKKKGSLGSLHNNHKLHGDLKDCRECHIQSDVLLIYKVNKNRKTLDLLRIGSHSDLF